MRANLYSLKCIFSKLERKRHRPQCDDSSSGAGANRHSAVAVLAASTTSAAHELERLAALRDQGALTDDEFATQKERILGTPSAPVVEAPPAPTTIGDHWVYVLIAVPLILAALAPVVPNRETFPLTWSFLIANLALILLDYRQLWRAGYRVHSRLLVAGTLIVPAYLFGRAGELRRGYKLAGLSLALYAGFMLIILSGIGLR